MGPGAKYPTARMDVSYFTSGPLRRATMLFVGQRSQAKRNQPQDGIANALNSLSPTRA
jgi:hypothetical protein